MPWRGPQYRGEFPSLGWAVADLIEAKCVVPDGDRAGWPFLLTDEQLTFLVHLYRVDPRTGRFHYGRGAQLTRPQKWGKGPLAAAIICAEAHPDGPVVPAGWDAAGEPAGRPWATPWIQVTAASEGQTANIFRALVPMIERGALAGDIPDTGETRINLPGGGRIEPVTSAARSRLGQRITHSAQDETQSWTQANGGRALADNQRRNLAGMGGRWVAYGNAWDPAEQSVAQQTAEAREPGVWLDDVEPGEGSVRNARDRRRMIRRVYGDSLRSERTGTGWVDPARIDAEICALLDRDAGQAERYFLNRKRAGEAAAFDLARWDQLARPDHRPPAGALVVVGVDGARFHDALAMVATEVQTGHQWPLGIWERPAGAGEDYEHPLEHVEWALSEALELFSVWRVYIDPQWVDQLVDRWQGAHGADRVIRWYTARPRQTAWAVRQYTQAIQAGDLSHDGDQTLARHIGAATRWRTNVRDDDGRLMWTIGKETRDSRRLIDAAMAGVLSWEARGDAIAAGATARKRSRTLQVW